MALSGWLAGTANYFGISGANGREGPLYLALNLRVSKSEADAISANASRTSPALPSSSDTFRAAAAAMISQAAFSQMPLEVHVPDDQNPGSDFFDRVVFHARNLAPGKVEKAP